MFKKRFLAAAILAGLSVSLAACGGSDDDNPDPTPPAPQPDPGPGPAPGPTPDPGPGPAPDPGPTPDPGPGPTPGPGGAGDCFNAAEYAVGSTWELEYNVSGSVTGTSVSAAEVLRRTDFAGYSALETEVATTTNYAGVGPIATTVLSYGDTPGGMLVELYGNVAEVDVMGLTTRSVSTYTPPYRMVAWTLSAGQTEAYSYTLRTETTITGSPVPIPPTTTEHTASGTWTFNGRESVTVPVGTFNACKFTQVEEGTTNELWYAPNFGVQVKSVSTGTDGGITMEMTKGTFNGASVAP